VLKHDDFVLTENVAILHYLAELYPAAQLLGGPTLGERAEVMRWLAFLNSDVHKSMASLFGYRKRQVENDPCADAAAMAAERKIRDYLKRLDQQLDGRDWIAGGRSVADPYLFVVLRWAAKLQIEADDLSCLTAFANDMYADASVRAALVAEEGTVSAPTWSATSGSSVAEVREQASVRRVYWSRLT